MPMEPQVVRELALRLALENAIRHGGSARPATVLGRLLAADPDLRAHRNEVAHLVADVVGQVNALPEAERKDRWAALPPASRPLGPPRAEREEGTLPALPGAQMGQVVLRFAPFPSGPLHIGNARAVVVNDEYRRRYQGRFLLVIDDTAGSAEKKILPEAYDLIREDLTLLGVTPDEVHYKSDRLERHYAFLPRLFTVDRAYVCLCDGPTLTRNRRAGIACPERDLPREVQEERWERMLAGGYRQGEAVVRLKTSMQDPNPAFRDRVLFRIWEGEHPRVGTRYRVWPMLEFSWAVDDVELGISHVIRGKDLVMEDQMETTIWESLGIRGPLFLHWGLLSVRDAKISKSKSAAEVLSGQYDGWADPRTWSFRSLVRRGILPEAIRSFILGFGLSQADITVPAEALYAENRRLLDPVTPRRIFVPDPLEVVVEDWPEDLRIGRLANHPERPDLGQRELPVDGRFLLPGEDLRARASQEIRLKDLANIQLSGKPTQGSWRARFTSRPNKDIPRLQWVPFAGSVPVSVLMVDGHRVEGRGESSLATGTPGEMFQFERFGFVRRDTEPVPADGTPRFVFAHG